MWKRFGVLRFVLFILVLLLTGAGESAAACGVDPTLPPEKFIWPVNGDVSQAWSLDCRTDRGHRGIDIAVPAGSTVKASASGLVSFVGYTPAEGGGTTITIDHANGLRSTYLHVTGPSVTKGQSVTQGQEIAISEGGALHFGIKLASAGHDTYFNPLNLLPAVRAPEETPLPPAADESGAPAPLEAVPPASPAPAPVSQAELSYAPQSPAPVPETAPASVLAPAAAPLLVGPAVDLDQDILPDAAPPPGFQASVSPAPAATGNEITATRQSSPSDYRTFSPGAWCPSATSPSTAGAEIPKVNSSAADLWSIIWPAQTMPSLAGPADHGHKNLQPAGLKRGKRRLGVAAVILLLTAVPPAAARLVDRASSPVAGLGLRYGRLQRP